MFGFEKKLSLYSDERILFVKDDCPHCRKVLNALMKIESQTFIPASKIINIVNLDADPTGTRELARFEKLEGHELGTPYLYYEGTTVSGVVDEDSMQKMLIQLIWG